MTFALGKQSEANLVGVVPKLVCCVRYAIKRTDIDFSVVEGVRTVERQRKLVASGASRTMQSYHLTGEAVDLAPYVDGRLQWQLPLSLRVARFMLFASRDLSVRLVCGLVWDRELGTLDPSHLDDEGRAYAQRWHMTHPRPTDLDPDAYWGPLEDPWHFQMVRGQ